MLARGMGHRLLLILPAVAVCVVLWVVLGAGGPVQVEAVQLLGGPTRGLERLSLLVRAFTITDGRRMPLPARRVRITARAADARASWTGVLDETGQVEVMLDFAQALPVDPSVLVEEVESGQVLGEGVLSLSAQSWQAAARRNGGWLPAQRRGELHIEVAPFEGTLAVPFASELLLRVSAPSSAGHEPGSQPTSSEVSDAELSLELEGAELVTPTGEAVTTARGAARVSVRPLEHAISLRVAARQGQRTGEWYGALPVVPGALHASAQARRLHVRSPIVRERAYVSWVTEHARLGGAIVPLAPDEAGGAEGFVDVPAEVRSALLTAPTFSVVASEHDKRSPGVVGWPMSSLLSPEPPQTLDAPDHVLLDGSEQALLLEMAARRHLRGIGALLLAGIGITMGGLFWYEVRIHRQRRDAGTGLIAGTPALVMASGRWPIWVALGSITLAVAALAYFAISAR
jgi:hypothetical protein